MTKRWVLIGRIHINGRNKQNTWQELAKYLKIKIKRLEDTKAASFTRLTGSHIKRKLAAYNKKHHTDFFID